MILTIGVINSYSQDTASYIKSGCIYSVLKSVIHQNGSPVVINFSYSNDSLWITGEIGANCGSSHIAIINKTLDTIFITTLDTGRMATCGCVFFFELKIKASANDTIVKFNGQKYNTKVIYSGFSELETNNSFIDIYPNPTGDYFTIQLKAGNQINKISILDNSGRLVKIIISKENRIDMTELPSGLYFIDVEINQQNHLFKKIIKK